ncbi:hypothetical protein [Streptomyces lydicus]|uniref:hypothetical protein n=1 Tax=Streptomyces lydicus TaxID=47763 RepID=UPI0037B6C74E
MLIMLIVALPITAGLLAAWIHQARMLAAERAARRLTEAAQARDVQALARHVRRELTQQQVEAAVLETAASVIDNALRGEREGDGHA